MTDAQKLKDFRKDKNLTQQQLADVLGLTQQTIAMVESGKEINAELKAENENLKRYKASKQASYESMQREWNRAVNANRELKADNKHLNDLLNQALKELEEHRDVFDKVKELIQKEINDCEHCDDCASCEYNCCTKQILQICDEVNQ